MPTLTNHWYWNCLSLTSPIYACMTLVDPSPPHWRFLWARSLQAVISFLPLRYAALCVNSRSRFPFLGFPVAPSKTLDCIYTTNADNRWTACIALASEIVIYIVTKYKMYSKRGRRPSQKAIYDLYIAFWHGLLNMHVPAGKSCYTPLKNSFLCKNGQSSSPFWSSSPVIINSQWVWVAPMKLVRIQHKYSLYTLKTLERQSEVNLLSSESSTLSRSSSEGKEMTF